MSRGEVRVFMGRITGKVMRRISLVLAVAFGVASPTEFASAETNDGSRLRAVVERPWSLIPTDVDLVVRVERADQLRRLLAPLPLGRALTAALTEAMTPAAFTALADAVAIDEAEFFDLLFGRDATLVVRGDRSHGHDEPRPEWAILTRLQRREAERVLSLLRPRLLGAGHFVVPEQNITLYWQTPHLLIAPMPGHRLERQMLRRLRGLGESVTAGNASLDAEFGPIGSALAHAERGRVTFLLRHGADRSLVVAEIDEWSSPRLSIRAFAPRWLIVELLHTAATVPPAGASPTRDLRATRWTEPVGQDATTSDHDRSEAVRWDPDGAGPFSIPGPIGEHSTDRHSTTPSLAAFGGGSMTGDALHARLAAWRDMADEHGRLGGPGSGAWASLGELVEAIIPFAGAIERLEWTADRSSEERVEASMRLSLTLSR